MAAEHYLLQNFKTEDDVFMLWRNSPAVIIGRNQNTYAEVNSQYAADHDIAVVRRLTGGGAVFHDLGNLNYTFISNADDDNTLNFARFCAPIIDALHDMGCNAELSGRNDITVGGKKISGSAQCVKNGRIMHHGTLLYCSDLSMVAGSLNVSADKLVSKGIKSVSSRVANIKELASSQMDVMEFAEYLLGRINGNRREFDSGEIKEIEALRDDIYSKWEWNYGKSQRFENEVRGRFPFGGVAFEYALEKGIICEMRITGDFFGRLDISHLEEKLRGCRFEAASLTERLQNVGDYISGATADDIAAFLAGRAISD